MFPVPVPAECFLRGTLGDLDFSKCQSTVRSGISDFLESSALRRKRLAQDKEAGSTHLLGSAGQQGQQPTEIREQQRGRENLQLHLPTRHSRGLEEVEAPVSRP